MKRRLISALLVCCMLMGCIRPSAWAAEMEETPVQQEAEAEQEAVETAEAAIEPTEETVAAPSEADTSQADANDRLMEDSGVYAILYSDGTMVFQHGNTTESGRTVTATYPVDLTGYSSASAVPWAGTRASITKVDFADTIQPQSTAYWFDDCSNLAEITNISHLETSNVRRMNNMFSDCYALTALDLSNFDTSNVTNMAFMFYNCTALARLNVSNFDTSNVTNAI